MEAFIESQFDYSPSIWNLCGRKTNASIYHAHEVALTAVFYHGIGPFKELT